MEGAPWRFTEAARKHDIDDADIIHAIRNLFRYIEQEYDGELRMLILGADRTVACWRSWSCLQMIRSV